MRTMHPSVLRALLPALLLASAACADATGSPAHDVGGEYVGELDTPYLAEGAALIDLISPDIREVSAPGRIFAARGVTERTLRIMVVNNPHVPAIGGPIVFHVRMPSGVAPPRSSVVAVASPENDARSFAGGYQVRWRRVTPSPSFALAPGGAPRRQTDPAPIPFARLIDPLFPGGVPLNGPEVILADGRGNANKIFDLGDVRGYLYQYPDQIPPATVWSR
jgi:hypothetical protein